MSQPAYTAVPDSEAGGGTASKLMVCAGSCCCGLYVLLVAAATYGITAKFLSVQLEWEQPMHDDKGRLWTPENFTLHEFWPGCERGDKTAEDFDKCAKPCFDSKLPSEVHHYNLESPYEIVSFPSRDGPDGQQTLDLKGWWLPASDEGAPIVVFTHGMSGSANQMRVQLPAYFLRKLGYSVLAPNLRDHGSSPDSNHPGRITWGWAYHLDVLGAWDWAVKEKAGGDATKVGLMGISMGGFASAIAAGLESKIPAVWIDGSVFDPYADVILPLFGFLGPLASLVGAPAWFIAEKIVGVDVMKYTPENSMPKRTEKLQVGMVVNEQDALAMPGKPKYTEVFKANHGVLQTTFFPDGNCNGEAHCVTALQWPDKYKSDLKTFWDCALQGNGCTERLLADAEELAPPVQRALSEASIAV